MNSIFNYNNLLSEDNQYTSLNSSNYKIKLINAKALEIEEPLASPSSTQYDSETLASPSQGMSPALQMSASRKSTEDTTAGDYIEEQFSEEEDMSQDEPEEEQGTPKLDEKRESMLKKLATKYKYDWKKVANKFNRVNGTSLAPSVLRDKYKNLPKPNMALRVKFTHTEDLLIAKLFSQFGCDWTHIATYFPTRTPIMLKNRYYSYIRKNDLLSNMIAETQDNKEEQLEIKSTESTDSEIKSEIVSEEIISEISEISYKYGIKNLIENYSDAIFNRQRFDMESCLSSELCVRVASKNFYMY